MDKTIINSKPDKVYRGNMPENLFCKVQIEAQRLGLDEIVVTPISSTDVELGMNVKLIVRGNGVVYERNIQHRSIYAGVESVLNQYRTVKNGNTSLIGY
jgi:hypothetical protein